MLEEAHALRKARRRHRIGYIESHGRQETRRLTAGLEIVPRKKVEYRGIEVEGNDLDAVLARKPQVVVVDEVAHTNLPGRRTEAVCRRAGPGAGGINVIGAFNIQHLESLNDIVQKAPGRRPRDGARQLPEGGRPGGDLDLASKT